MCHTFLAEEGGVREGRGWGRERGGGENEGKGVESTAMNSIANQQGTNKFIFHLYFIVVNVS